MRRLNGPTAERLALLFRRALRGCELLPLEMAELDAVAEAGAVLELPGSITVQVEPGSLMPWRDSDLAEDIAWKNRRAREVRSAISRISRVC